VGKLGYLDFGLQLLVISDEHPPDKVPDFTSLGVTGHLYGVF
jgi:hypothetical protein